MEKMHIDSGTRHMLGWDMQRIVTWTGVKSSSALFKSTFIIMIWVAVYKI